MLQGDTPDEIRPFQTRFHILCFRICWSGL